MDEQQFENETQASAGFESEPVKTDNSDSEQAEKSHLETEHEPEGQSETKDPSKELILGKFKSVEDLSKAYQELQKQQGLSSDELGYLRKELSSVNSVRQALERYQQLKDEVSASIRRDREKYDKPEYFQDPTFREIYKEAVLALGETLDTDRFVNLLESYVSARIFANDKKKAATSETEQILDSMSYGKNPKSSLAKPKKNFDEMTDSEVDEMLERLL